jgi:acetyltransferase-like isoleucine patch superfamily enzyme
MPIAKGSHFPKNFPFYLILPHSKSTYETPTMKFTFANFLEKLDEFWDCTITLQTLRLTDLLGTSYLANRYFRPTVLRFAGFNLGQNCYLRPGMTMMSRRHNLSIGNNTSINMDCHFDSYSPIQIGSYCNIGRNVSFINTLHEVVSDFKNLRANIATPPIIIEDFAWVAANATVLCGVKIGRGSVVAAGAIVTKDVPPHCLVGGIPAKVLRRLDSTNDPLALQAAQAEAIGQPIPLNRPREIRESIQA